MCRIFRSPETVPYILGMRRVFSTARMQDLHGKGPAAQDEATIKEGNAEAQEAPQQEPAKQF